MSPSKQPATVAPDEFRQALRACPTAVAVITSGGPEPVAMVIGSFGSVSLDPPLVMFMPAKSSSTWPSIEQAGRFAVSVLGHDHQEVCDRIVAKRGDHFSAFGWDTRSAGSPILDGCPAWLDCRIEDVHEAGDHWIVVAEVLALGVSEDLIPPLVFWNGMYKTLTSLAPEAPSDEPGQGPSPGPSSH